MGVILLEGVNILLVDDNLVNQKIAGFMLKKQGAEVTYAMNGEEAISLLIAHDFDLVLMDLQMPGMDGFVATRYIRNELKKDVTIIALTADLFANDNTACIDAGMNACISKPFDIGNLSSLYSSLKGHIV